MIITGKQSPCFCLDPRVFPSYFLPILLRWRSKGAVGWAATCWPTRLLYIHNDTGQTEKRKQVHWSGTQCKLKTNDFSTFDWQNVHLYFIEQAGRYFLPNRFARISTSFSRTSSEKTVEPMSKQKVLGLNMIMWKKKNNKTNNSYSGISFPLSWQMLCKTTLDKDQLITYKNLQ